MTTKGETMGMAWITEFGTNSSGKRCFAIQNNDGSKDWYDQGEGVEDPPVYHADFYWRKDDRKLCQVMCEGEKRPDTLIARDGGKEGHHKYHRRIVA
jgi:hypothetical protein